MSCSTEANCTCGCCAGTSVRTPEPLTNPPGQPALTYRVGTWNTFRASMQARLSSSTYPALAALKTRESDDFTLAFLDASAVVMDILTFYQERLANESYLRTAGQIRSLVEMSRLIGYQPAPGVAASTFLAFTLKTTPGYSPNPAAPAITIPAGTQVQSVPAQGQKPQTFETSSDVLAKPDWNALAVQTTCGWLPKTGDTSVWLEGTATHLSPGDAILLVGDERRFPKSNEDLERWDIRIVIAVDVDSADSRTRITWHQGLGSPSGSVPPASQNVTVYALRQRAALFGYSALNPNLLSTETAARMAKAGLLQGGTEDKPNYEWASYTQGGGVIDLDSGYPKVVQGGWLALVLPGSFEASRSLSGTVNLYQVSSVSQVARSDFGLSGKITRVVPDVTTGLTGYKLDTSLVLAQSEALPPAPQPIDHPLYGTLIDLADVRPDLLKVTAIAIFGKAQKLTVAPNVNSLTFVPDLDGGTVALKPGDTLTLASSMSLPLNLSQTIPAWSTSATAQTLNVTDATGRSGKVFAALADLILTPAGKSDPVISEYAEVLSISTVTPAYPDAPHTRIVLKTGLAFCYDRTATTINANVVEASNGSSVTEILGSGSAATPNQSFALKQTPLTFVQAPTANGRRSTLQVRASGVQWNEVPSLYQQAPTARVFATLNQQPGGNTTIDFGDSVEGATLPTGQSNIQARYRVGSGSSGNVAASTITTLMDRPLGVSGVTNPESATGGVDPATIDDIRSGAPQTVLTLGRAVSLADYQNFAANFTGIAKALALWIPAGPARGVFLTLAGIAGAALPPGSPTLNYLAASLKTSACPLTPVHFATFIETLFGLSADIAYDPAYDPKAVEAQVRQSLTTTYSFANRTFGQGVSVDEVATIIQNTPGVLAVNVKSLAIIASSTAGDLSQTTWNAWLASSLTLPRPSSPTRICAYLPIPSLTALPPAAELLVLHPDPTYLTLGVLA